MKLRITSLILSALLLMPALVSCMDMEPLASPIDSTLMPDSTEPAVSLNPSAATTDPPIPPVEDIFYTSDTYTIAGWFDNGFMTACGYFVNTDLAFDRFDVGDAVLLVYNQSSLFLYDDIVSLTDQSGKKHDLFGSINEVFEVHSPDDMIAVPEKPVIYLYPEVETVVSVALDFQGKLTVTIPQYKDGWTVTASPNGKLTDADGNMYPYLFWEGIANEPFAPIDEGACVPGVQTEAYLRETLSALGLIDAEIADFIEYWLPRMEMNTYNLIRFLYEDYTDRAPLTVSPSPDSMLRVFMVFTPSDIDVSLPAQEIRPFVREGFAVIEWGGCEMRRAV